MRKSFNTKVDMLNGNIFRAMVLFAIPIFLSSIFQQLYNTVDTIIVSHSLGENALAAVGAASPVYGLLMGFALGIGGGVSIVTARSFGEKNEEKIRSSAAAAVIIGTAISVIMTAVSLLLLAPFLRLMNTPPEIIEDAYAYSSIIMMSTGITFAYNMCSGILRSIGDSVMPLVFLVISSFVNIFLDIFFISVLHFGVEGAALATVISQIISVILCLTYILKRVKFLIPAKRHFRIDKKLYGEMLTQGLSMAFMQCFVSAGSVILQSGINDLGSLIIAGHTAANKVYQFCMLPFMALISATSTFVSQNYGAKNITRIRLGMKYSYLYSASTTVLLTAVFWTLGPLMIRFISGSEEAVIIENGTRFLQIAAPAGFALGLVLSTRSALQAIGSKILPIFSSIIELIGKIIFMMIFIPKFGYSAVIFCEPVIWCFMAVELLIAFWTNKKLKTPNAVPAGRT